MRRRDIELITALVAGDLQDETEALARIQASAGLRAEYEAQVEARDALRSVPPVSLTASESAAMRRDLWTDLKGAPTGQSRRSLTGWAYAAAGGLAVVALVAVLGQMGQDGMTARVAAEDDGESALADPLAETPATTVSEVTAGDAGAPEATDSDQLASFAMQARMGDLAYESASAAASPCIEDAGVTDMEVLGELEEEGRRYVLLVPDLESIGPDTPIVFVDLETCEIVLRDG